MGNSVGIALFVILIANKIPHLLNLIQHTGSVLASGDKYAAIPGQPSSGVVIARPSNGRDDADEDAGPAISGSTSEHPLAAHKGKRGTESEQHVQGVHDLPANWFMGGVLLTGEEWRRRLGDSVVEANLRTQEYICLRYFLCT